jgi:hypothetical protein
VLCKLSKTLLLLLLLLLEVNHAVLVHGVLVHSVLLQLLHVLHSGFMVGWGQQGTNTCCSTCVHTSCMLRKGCDWSWVLLLLLLPKHLQKCPPQELLITHVGRRCMAARRCTRCIHCSCYNSARAAVCTVKGPTGC